MGVSLLLLAVFESIGIVKIPEYYITAFSFAGMLFSIESLLYGSETILNKQGRPKRKLLLILSFLAIASIVILPHILYRFSSNMSNISMTSTLISVGMIFISITIRDIPRNLPPPADHHEDQLESMAQKLTDFATQIQQLSEGIQELNQRLEQDTHLKEDEEQQGKKTDKP